MSSFNPAVRKGVTLLLGFAGQSGSGKTFSALKVAQGIAGGKPFAGIDSEAGRMLHYADMFKFDHAEVRPPFRPSAYLEKILEAEKLGYPVIVVDNFSHEWIGEGGLQDWHDEIVHDMVEKKRAQAERQGWIAKFDEDAEAERQNTKAWIEPKVAHKKFVQRLLQLRAHLVICFRAEEKLEIAQVVDEKTGRKKTEYRKLQSITGADGFVPITEKNMPYELTASLLLKADRPGFPIPIKLQEQHRAMFPPDRPIDAAAGVAIARWAAGDGLPPLQAAVTLAAVVAAFKQAQTVKELQAAGAAAQRLPEEDKGPAMVAYREQLERVKGLSSPAGTKATEPPAAEEREPGSDG